MTYTHGNRAIYAESDGKKFIVDVIIHWISQGKAKIKYNGVEKEVDDTELEQLQDMNVSEAENRFHEQIKKDYEKDIS